MSNRRRSVRSAWQVLAWAALSLVCFQFGLGLALDRWLPAVRDPEYAAKERQLRARRREAPDRPLVLALGSSRTLLGLQAGRVSASAPARAPVLCFNFGLIGGGPVLEGVCLRRLLAAGIRPDLLLVEVLLPALNEAGDRALEEDWLNGSRLSAAELLSLRRYHSHPERLLYHWSRARCLPCWQYQADLRRWLPLDRQRLAVPSAVPFGGIDPFGWHAHVLPNLTPEKRRRLAELARWQYRASLGDFHPAAPALRALDGLLACCRREGIPVALVLMPEATTFRALYPPALRQGLDALLADRCRREHIPLIDARTWVADDGFWDGHHLLPAGAAAFTERLQREALPPLLPRSAHGQRGSRFSSGR